MTVRSALAALIARWMLRSLMLSRAEVPSSRIRIGGFFRKTRARAMPLALAAGEVLASLGDAGLVPAGHPHDLVVDAGHPGGVDDLLPRGVAVAVGDVLRDRAGEEEGVLPDVADESPMASRVMLSRGTPPSVAEPPLGWVSRIRTRSQVDFPPPDRPATPIVSPCRMASVTPSRPRFALPSAVRYSARRSSAVKSGAPTAMCGSRGSAGVNERSTGTARMSSRSPTFRLLSWATSMKRWISFRGAMTFRYSTENVRMSP